MTIEAPRGTCIDDTILLDSDVKLNNDFRLSRGYAGSDFGRALLLQLRAGEPNRLLKPERTTAPMGADRVARIFRELGHRSQACCPR